MTFQIPQEHAHSAFHSQRHRPHTFLVKNPVAFALCNAFFAASLSITPVLLFDPLWRIFLFSSQPAPCPEALLCFPCYCTRKAGAVTFPEIRLKRNLLLLYNTSYMCCKENLFFERICFMRQTGWNGKPYHSLDYELKKNIWEKSL